MIGNFAGWVTGSATAAGARVNDHGVFPCRTARSHSSQAESTSPGAGFAALLYDLNLSDSDHHAGARRQASRESAGSCMSEFSRLGSERSASAEVGRGRCVGRLCVAASPRLPHTCDARVACSLGRFAACFPFWKTVGSLILSDIVMPLCVLSTLRRILRMHCAPWRTLCRGAHDSSSPETPTTPLSSPGAHRGFPSLPRISDEATDIEAETPMPGGGGGGGVGGMLSRRSPFLHVSGTGLAAPDASSMPHLSVDLSQNRLYQKRMLRRQQADSASAAGLPPRAITR